LIPTSSVTDALTGTYLPDAISDITVSPSTSEFFYIAKTPSGSIGNVYNVKTGSERRVFSSAFSEWLPEWKGSSIYMTTKAHSSFMGVGYVQSLTKNSFSRLFGGVFGLTTHTNKDERQVLVGNGYNLSIFNTISKTSVSIPDVFTLPEKCFWREDQLMCFGQEYEPEGNFPESWYQGKASFNDSLFSLNTITGESYKVATMSELYGSTIYVDVLRPNLSEDEKILVFINKIDMTPWYMDIGGLFDYLETKAVQ
jgi:hypothetical protein